MIPAGMETHWTGHRPASPALLSRAWSRRSRRSWRSSARAQHRSRAKRGRRRRSGPTEATGATSRPGAHATGSTLSQRRRPTIGAYLADRASDLKVGSLNRRVAAIVAAHRFAGHALDRKHPAIGAVLAGIRRLFGSRQEAKAAILTADLRKMVRALPVTLAGAFRRSELAALDLEDVEIMDQGLIVAIRRSKTDQEGAGRKIGIPRGRKGTCAATALQDWIAAGGITAGTLFTALDRGHAGGRLSGQAIAEIVKRAAVQVGLDPARYGGHSLRSGFATSAARGGADLSFVMLQTGHKSADSARRYVQQGRLLSNPASKAAGL